MTDSATTPPAPVTARVAAARARARADRDQRRLVNRTVRAVLAKQGAETSVSALVQQVANADPELGEWMIISTLYEDMRGPDLEVDASGTVRLNAHAFDAARD